MLLWGGLAGGALLIVVVIVLMAGGGGGDDSTPADTGTETAKPVGPTKAEPNQGIDLYNTAKKLVAQADEFEQNDNKDGAARLRKEAEAKLDQAIGIWNAALQRIPESEQQKFTSYEDRHVVHWVRLKRQLFRPDH